MNRDLVLHQIVAVEAQLRRLLRLSNSINDATEYHARMPALIAETHRTLQSTHGRIVQSEGGKPC